MKEPNKEAMRWFSQAESDTQFVKKMLSEGTYPDIGCFISQQAGEKALKACLYAVGKRKIFGHSLFELVRELEIIDASFHGIIDDTTHLDRFYIPTRYPNGLPGGSPHETYKIHDLQEAHDKLFKVMQVCTAFLRSKGIKIQNSFSGPDSENTESEDSGPLR